MLFYFTLYNVKALGAIARHAAPIFDEVLFPILISCTPRDDDGDYLASIHDSWLLDLSCRIRVIFQIR